MKNVKNPLPVSIKFFERLQGRLRYIFRNLGLSQDANEFARTVVMGHCCEETARDLDLDQTLGVIYLTLRNEVRTAIQRSRDARMRAKKRAFERKKAQEEAERNAANRAKYDAMMARRAAAAAAKQTNVKKAECPAIGHPAGDTVVSIPEFPVKDAPEKGADYSSACDFSAYSLSSFSCTSAGTNS